MNIEKQIEIFKFTVEQEKTKKQILAIFARLCSGAKIKGSLFSPSTTLNATKDPHTDIPSENIPLKVTNDDHEQITQKLLEFGFIEKQCIFWVDGDNNLDYSCDEDEAALLVEELEKSKKQENSITTKVSSNSMKSIAATFTIQSLEKRGLTHLSILGIITTGLIN